jgi:hypothetical protein
MSVNQGRWEVELGGLFSRADRGENARCQLKNKLKNKRLDMCGSSGRVLD